MGKAKTSSNRIWKNLKAGIVGAFKVNMGTYIAFIALFILACLLSDRFLTFSNQMTIVRAISTNALCAFGMTFVILTGGIDLSVGSTMALGGCLTVVLIARCNFAAGLAIIIALILGFLIGALNGLAVTKMKMPPFIATLATMNVIRGFAYIITDSKPVSVTNSFFEFAGAGFIGPVPIAAIYVIIVFVVLWVTLNRTKYGRHIYAAGGNLTAAKYSGINTDFTICVAYIMTGVLSAFSGIVLCSRLNSGQPTIGEGAELDAIAACIVGGTSMNGGRGTLTGTLVGALIIGIISNILNLMGINSNIQLILKGLIILLSVYIDIFRKKK